MSFEPVFVEFIPAERDLKPGKLYVSMTYSTVVHLCASGCGEKVVLPLSPAQYRLQYDGVAVSVTPSVGNWSYPCRSHYWIRHNRVEWAPAWSSERVEEGRVRDQRDLDDQYASSHRPAPTKPSPVRRIWGWLKRTK